MDLKTRAVNILKSPKTEWPVIAEERTDTATLYREYIVPLAAIPPVCGLIGRSLIGIHGFHAPFGRGLIFAIVHYLLTLIGVYVVAFIVAKLAPTFSGTEDRGAALRLSAYAATSSWLGGIFELVPILWILSLLASLYSLYLLYTGLPVMMKAPEEKSFGYALSVILAAILISIAVSIVLGFLVATPMMM